MSDAAQQPNARDRGRDLDEPTSDLTGESIWVSQQDDRQQLVRLMGAFPQLQLLGLIGQGGMGAVYKVRQLSLDRVAALKVLPERIEHQPAFAQRFTREARALGRLSHPNIVTVYDFGEVQGTYFLIMEYVEGMNLRALMRESRPTVHQTLSVVSQMCDALEYAHDEGVVHRDIKPENILIDRKGRVKIADFGLAKLLIQADTVAQTQFPQVMGTVHYMAPEQFEAPLSVDQRADIYSMGVVFYEMLTAELPIGRFSPPSRKAVIDPLPNSAALRSGLDDVVLRSLEKEPQLRFQRASEIRFAIDPLRTLNALLPSSLTRSEAEPPPDKPAQGGQGHTQLAQSDQALSVHQGLPLTGRQHEVAAAWWIIVVLAAGLTMLSTFVDEWVLRLGIGGLMLIGSVALLIFDDIRRLRGGPTWPATHWVPRRLSVGVCACVFIASLSVFSTGDAAGNNWVWNGALVTMVFALVPTAFHIIQRTRERDEIK